MSLSPDFVLMLFGIKMPVVAKLIELFVHVSVYYKLSLSVVHAMISFVLSYIHVNNLCLNQRLQTMKTHSD